MAGRSKIVKYIKEKLKWITVILLLVIISLIMLLIHRHLSENTTTVQIIQDGEIIDTINLQSIVKPYEFEVISTDGGKNIVRVENGRIGIIDASCPDKICVNQGFIENSSLPIVCLPNKLSVVIINDSGETDAVAGAI